MKHSIILGVLLSTSIFANATEFIDAASFEGVQVRFSKEFDLKLVRQSNDLGKEHKNLRVDFRGVKTLEDKYASSRMVCDVDYKLVAKVKDEDYAKKAAEILDVEDKRSSKTLSSDTVWTITRSRESIYGQEFILRSEDKSLKMTCMKEVVQNGFIDIQVPKATESYMALYMNDVRFSKDGKEFKPYVETVQNTTSPAGRTIELENSHPLDKASQ